MCGLRDAPAELASEAKDSGSQQTQEERNDQQGTTDGQIKLVLLCLDCERITVVLHSRFPRLSLNCARFDSGNLIAAGSRPTIIGRGGDIRVFPRVRKCHKWLSWTETILSG